jgi:hypothetical protein
MQRHKITIPIRVCSRNASIFASSADYFQVAKLLLKMGGVCCYIALKLYGGEPLVIVLPSQDYPRMPCGNYVT